MNFTKHKNIYFLLSLILIIPGIISLVLFGLKPSIDFTGGSRLEVAIQSNLGVSEFENKLKDSNITFISAQKTESGVYIIRTEALDQEQKDAFFKTIKTVYPSASERSFETVGATIGRETTLNAVYAVAIASIAITLYIAFAFRHVSRPVLSWKFGVCAILAVIHDVLLVLGLFSILGYIFRIEVDSLFITALLTIIGFSVHDTIVVFDRIRENLKKYPSVSFEKNVNSSILETLNRSLNTSITVIFVLVTLLLFGGESVRWFVVALLVGIVVGTYSSIFTASQLLIVWHDFDKKRKEKIH